MVRGAYDPGLLTITTRRPQSLSAKGENILKKCNGNKINITELYKFLFYFITVIGRAVTGSGEKARAVSYPQIYMQRLCLNLYQLCMLNIIDCGISSYVLRFLLK
jgi:hypothetical protein